jgi:hypothetical protein
VRELLVPEHVATLVAAPYGSQSHLMAGGVSRRSSGGVSSSFRAHGGGTVFGDLASLSAAKEMWCGPLIHTREDSHGVGLVACAAVVEPFLLRRRPDLCHHQARPLRC